MFLEELYDYKNRMMRDILSDEEIVNLITDDPYYRSNPEKLAYRQVFPYEHIPDTLEEAYNYVCFDVDVHKDFDKQLFSPVINVWIYCHKSLLRLPEGGVRFDVLASKITKAVIGSRWYGLTKIELDAVRRFALTTDYQGKEIIFTTNEIAYYNQHLRQAMPKNRKQWDD